jgi:hypothetical protein
MMHLDPHQVAAFYDALRLCEPMRAWNLPESDDLAFIVSRSRVCAGWFRPGAFHKIALSARCISSPSALLPVLAHEMIHLHQHLKGSAGPGEHNAEFYKLARLACRKLTFDFAAFA